MKKNIILSSIFISLFALLMIYGLNHSSNFNPSPLVGKSAPLFTAPLAQGGMTHAEESYQKGLWTVVNFWSSTCYVCRSEAHELEEFYQKSIADNPQKIQFISINIQDDIKSILDWQKNYKQTFPVVVDQNGLISVDFGVTGTPETFFINPNGIVRFRVAGELNQKIILDFIEWLSTHPNENQTETSKFLSQIAAMN